MKIVNYLGVTLNLNDGSYRPYQAINRVLELKNETTKLTDILEDKRNIQVL